MIHTLRSVLACGTLLIAGCVFDADDVCGPNQHEGPMGTCLCDKGYAADGSGVCTKQKANPKALGVDCDVTDAPCTDAKYSECHVVTGTTGYCTNTGCTSTKDCDGEYYCDDSESPSYCKRPATGEGEPCTKPAECEGFDADFCLVNPVMSACVVANCKSDSECTPGFSCEDYSAVLPGTPPFCAPPM